MFGPTKIYFIIFGLLTIAGGVMGYVKAGSTVSLIAGSISGLLLLLAAFLLPSHRSPASRSEGSSRFCSSDISCQRSFAPAR